MQTLHSIAESLYEKINVSEVLDIITGEVYNGNIPEGVQDLENISVNTLVLGQGQIQRGMVMVNIHVPDKKTTYAGKNFTGNADSLRLDQITRIVIPLIENAEILNVNLTIQSFNMIEERQKNQHYINIRVVTHSPNLKL